MWQRIRLIGVTTIAVVLTGSGFASGFRLTSNQSTDSSTDATQWQVESSQRAAIERQILNWIVERNPDAKMRDFKGFVETLFDVSRKSNIEWQWILALADKESQMRPRAIGTSGEIGLMQIMPATAKLIATRIKDRSFKEPGPIVRDRVTGKIGYASLGSLGDPRVNIRYGTLYLKWQKDFFRHWPVALRAYNRNPDSARENRPLDRYAEDIAFRFIALRDQFR